MSLTDKEKNYINKIVSSGGDLDLELIIDVINKKREQDNQVEFEMVAGFLEEISSKSDHKSKPNKQFKQAEKIAYAKDIEQIVNKNKHIVAGVLEELLPVINEILKPQKPKKYLILSGKTQAYLEQEVKKYMRDDWQPYGGVSSASFGVSPVGGNQYIQAMVKY